MKNATSIINCTNTNCHLDKVTLFNVSDQGGSKHGLRTFGICYEDCYAGGNLAFRLQYLFAIINKMSKIGFSTVAVAQWLGVGVVITGWCELKVRARVEIFTQLFSAIIFISVLSGLMDFNDTVILCIVHPL